MENIPIEVSITSPTPAYLPRPENPVTRKVRAWRGKVPNCELLERPREAEPQPPAENSGQKAISRSIGLGAQALARLWAAFCIHHSAFCLRPRVALRSHWGRIGVALGSHGGGFGVPIGWLSTGFEVALMSQGSGFGVALMCRALGACSTGLPTISKKCRRHGKISVKTRPGVRLFSCDCAFRDHRPA